MGRDVLVYAEFIDSRVHPVTFELLAKAREIASRLNGSVVAVIGGWRASDAVGELIARGADGVYLYDYEEDIGPNPLLQRDHVVEVVKELRPKLVLFGATQWGRSVAPRVAAKLGTGLTADCLDVYVDENGDIVQVRPAFTGNLIAHIKTLTEPVMATVRYRVFRPLQPDPSRKGKVIKRLVAKSVLEMYRQDFAVLERVRVKEVSLPDADIVVAGGRGLRRREDLKMLEELAKLLGGVVGVSRPLVDAGWISKDHQVGFSGNIVKPRVYLAFGISGAPQHLAGMRDSKIVVSVNIDPSAPIARHSDIFVVADLYELLPRLIEEVRKIRGGG